MKPTLLFFDFYTLSLLNYFAGENSLNHENRIRRIKELYEQKVDELYDDIKRCLTYSVIREFRHYIDYGPCSRYCELSRKCRDLYTDGSLHGFLDKKPDSLKIPEGMIHSIYIGFMERSWDSNYGGHLWGVACKFLLEHPDNSTKKELWVDRILDLQHNNGHILDKTHYLIISEEHTFPRYNEKNGKRVKRVNNYYNALDYRKYAKTLSDLAEFSSPKVSRLVTANLNLLPLPIR